jgi:hypothetical protein
MHVCPRYEVEISWFLAAQKVAHAAAHQVGLGRGGMNRAEDASQFGVNRFGA